MWSKRFFFDEFGDLLERLATFSVPLMIVGDFNIHFDDPADANTARLSELLSHFGLRHHVDSATHLAGHTLDLLITREDQLVRLQPIETPLLSDHSFDIADIECALRGVTSVRLRPVRRYRSMDIDAFIVDLLRSDRVIAPPDDVTTAFECYDTTLREPLNEHAPVQLSRISCRQSTRWYDRGCSSAKRLTHRLERRYRRLHTDDALSAWRDQFNSQCRLYHEKFTAFWLTTVDACRNDQRLLWRTVNSMLQPPPQQATQLSVGDFATFFRDKVSSIRSSTAAAAASVINLRRVSSLCSFKPTDVAEIIALLKNSPSKSCDLDPIPTWQLKCLSPHIAPVICDLCNISMRTRVFPSQLKQALVLPLLKKPSLDLNATSSYRPISNFSFISKLIERIVCKHFADHVSSSQLFPAQQSAYRAFHSTETAAVLSVHNGLVRAVDNGQVSSLMLLDLTVRHSTLSTTTYYSRFYRAGLASMA
jgi:hypothetical protein